MADQSQTRMEILTEFVEEYLERLELSHYKCDLDGDDFCYAEEYGDGTSAEHEKIRSINALLDDNPST